MDYVTLHQKSRTVYSVFKTCGEDVPIFLCGQISIIITVHKITTEGNERSWSACR